MARTLVIGDIHGALMALQELIEKVELQTGDKLIFLGDYVDGWSQSAQVIDYLIALDQKHECVFIKGNHDWWCENWLNGAQANNEWLLHGGRETVESYVDFDDSQRKIHLSFFNRMKGYHVDKENRLFIHAGFASMHGPAKERHESNFLWDRTLLEVALAVDKNLSKESPFYPKRLALYEEIFIGHTPTTNYGISVPLQAANVWDVDTGAAFKGKISALDIDTKEFWQSEAPQKLYPNEKGRNK
ncbi:metallophosphoesterase family protein [Pinibacter aurantiacus]|uniref:Serine/threonine protein phosphatase n=1 Tax=Pinibacter aurantiacus TaxID=2851599 RepID=A0A9E2SFY6_9BACT|nr:metallophosphoesterase family protein [Pinibacter aurantiacus]MBV4359665.1 serine/threonine protein phosphatase [Pinibacter aurantiacus]